MKEDIIKEFIKENQKLQRINALTNNALRLNPFAVSLQSLCTNNITAKKKQDSQ